MTAMPLLEVRDLALHYPVRGGLLHRVTAQVRAVDGVSFRIAPGRTLGLVGESGCGKSTFGRAVLRLKTPTAGQVVFEGVDLTALSRRELLPWRQRMQIIFQDPWGSLNPRRSVAEAIREPLDIHRIGTPASRRARVFELLDLVGLAPRMATRYPHEFSGGQRQRIGIARALALEPRFIVADEPVSALDVSVQSQVLNLICRLKQELGIAFLFISHDLAVIQHVSDDVAVMYLGRIVERASVAQLYAAPRHPYTEALLSAVPQLDERGGRRTVLQGDVPSPMAPPPGCAFHGRCPRVQPTCRAVVPVLKDIGDGHHVACHLYP